MFRILERNAGANMESGVQILIVLVVEDEWLLREEIVDAFRHAGWSVLDAASGEGALAYLRTDEHIDLVVTDIQLTGEMTGWDVAEAARASRPDIPVIYVSGTPRQFPREVSGSVFFAKPYQTSDLLDACQRLTVTAH
jgi:CheY-like chemotaxis protein